MHRTIYVMCLLAISMLASRSIATVVPALDLRSLVNAADTIVVGEVTATASTGRTLAKIRGHDMWVDLVHVQMRVHQVIKGSAGADLEFQMERPVQGMGYRSVPAVSYRLEAVS